MQIKTILYPIHDTHLHDSLSALSNLCLRENIHLSVVVFGESLPAPPMTGGNPEAATIWAQRLMETETRLRNRTNEVADQLQLTGIRADIRAELGDGLLVDDVIGQYAPYADIALMQRHTNTKIEAAFGKRLCHGVLFQSGKPVLLYDNAPPEHLEFNKVMVAWDGKPASNRALSAAFPLLARADSIHILRIHEQNRLQDSEEEGWELSTYLARHQLDITLENLENEGRKVSTTIQNRARKINADLIIMGAYDRSRLRERLFGGTTIEMLDYSGIPVLLAH